ncbi:MAG: NAD-dependent epimerase/dehydratase family protein [Chitinophagales bacterium]|nr:NAD-dependent epimerase/dehydratase family protein [Chitinophagales bacterium]
MPERILITGANGQIGSELSLALSKIYGEENIINTDIKYPSKQQGIFEQLDILDEQRLAQLVGDYRVSQIYHLAAILSAAGEQKPKKAWEINMTGLFNVLDTAVNLKVAKVFWPSTIAVFGNSTPKNNTPQHTVAEPQTVYGISKLAGENWCQYYFEHKGLDVRSLRYPGLISYLSPPGGGTTDYAVDIFYQALEKGSYECFLAEDTRLPMMYMPDAIRATIELMQAPAEQISIRTSYNIAALSFTPAELAKAIQKHLGHFKITYQPDYRQQIAATWPGSIDDSQARKDWHWQPAYSIDKMTKDMIGNLSLK